MAEQNKMQTTVKNVLKKIYLDEFARDLFLNVKRTKRLISSQLRRKIGRLDRKLIDDYLNEHKVRKLHIGCGDNILSDWLNSDYFPESDHVIQLDATERFPFGDATFDFVFSEHMIEHIPYSKGMVMLSECYRILKPNGRIRISTPDLSFLIDLYKIEKSELQKEYIRWSTNNCIKNAPFPADTFVINNYVRDWGHLFIYDEKILHSSLKMAGFTNIVKCNLNNSEDEVLQNLENNKRMQEGFLQLETLTLEGIK